MVRDKDTGTGQHAIQRDVPTACSCRRVVTHDRAANPVQPKERIRTPDDQLVRIGVRIKLLGETKATCVYNLGPSMCAVAPCERQVGVVDQDNILQGGVAGMGKGPET